MDIKNIICKLYYQGKISRFFDHDLPPELFKKTEEHISACAICKEKYEGYKRISSLIKSSESYTVSPFLWQRIERKLDNEDNIFPEEKPLVPVFKPFKISIALISVAAAVLIFNQLLFIRAVKKIKTAHNDSVNLEAYRLADRLLFEDYEENIADEIVLNELTGTIFEIKNTDEKKNTDEENKMIYNFKGGWKLC